MGVVLQVRRPGCGEVKRHVHASPVGKERTPTLSSSSPPTSLPHAPAPITCACLVFVTFCPCRWRPCLNALPLLFPAPLSIQNKPDSWNIFTSLHLVLRPRAPLTCERFSALDGFRILFGLRGLCSPPCGARTLYVWRSQLPLPSLACL